MATAVVDRFPPDPRAAIRQAALLLCDLLLFGGWRVQTLTQSSVTRDVRDPANVCLVTDPVFGLPFSKIEKPALAA